MKKIVAYIVFILLPVWVSSQTKIKSFYFESNQSVPTPYSQNQLAFFKDSFNKGQVTILEIYAYTDSIGSVPYNDSLAKKRLNYICTKLDINTNSSIALKPYGLVRKYDVTDFKHWRRVDIYYQINTNSNLIQEQIIDSIEVVKTLENPINKIDESPVEGVDFILNVQFIEGTSKIEQYSFKEIQKLYQFLLDHPEEAIVIRGHVCCGNNMRISRSRARAVYKELIEMGIDKKRLDFIGMSNKEPLVYPEKTTEDRQRNRRVDIQFKNIDL